MSSSSRIAAVDSLVDRTNAKIAMAMLATPPMAVLAKPMSSAATPSSTSDVTVMEAQRRPTTPRVSGRPSRRSAGPVRSDSEGCPELGQQAGERRPFGDRQGLEQAGLVGEVLGCCAVDQLTPLAGEDHDAAAPVAVGDPTFDETGTLEPV